MEVRELLDIEVSVEDRKLNAQAKGYLSYLASKGISAILVMGRQGLEDNDVVATIKMSEGLTVGGLATLMTACNMHSTELIRRMNHER